jgi:hypothetical protein
MHGYFSAEKFLVLTSSRSQGISEMIFSLESGKGTVLYFLYYRDIVR